MGDSLAHDVAHSINAAKTFIPDTHGGSANPQVREGLTALSTALTLLMLSPFGFLMKLGEKLGTTASTGISGIGASASFISIELSIQLQKLDTTVFASGELNKYFEQTVTSMQDTIVAFANSTFQDPVTKDSNFL